MKLDFECRSCKAKGFWVQTTKGKRMPVDAEPVVAGNLMVRQRQHRIPLAVYVTPNPSVKCYISHFVTCPQRKQWRQKR